MRMDLSFNLTQEQKLRLTQEMQLSIKVLQMPVNELREYIDNEFAENPIVEMNETTFSDRENNEENKDKFSHKEFIKYLDFDDYSSKNYRSNEENDNITPFTFISEKKSLKEFLHEQVSELSIDKYKRMICDYIIENLDNKGYLEISIEEICGELEIEQELGNSCLNMVQSLEPYGIGARNLKECLILQLKKLNLHNDVLEDIIESHLNNVADAKYVAISNDLKILPREAQRYGDIIKKLEPKPSRGFYTGEEVNFIIPDGEIRKINDEFVIIMNDRVIPKLCINEEYKKILSTDNNDETTEYVKEKINKALFLIKSIDQRRSTLYRVLEKIIQRQKLFFEKGRDYLVPMTLREISEDLGLHESTISRAIKEKYILTTVGTVKVKELFITGLSSKIGDDEMGVISIKNMIKDLVEKENKNKPISDQLICDELNKNNVNISRRTVAKYREELGIKSSSKRKRI